MPTFDLTSHHPEAYRLLISSFLPRPIAWVSTRSKSGQRNLAPFSFAMAVCANPFTLAFAPMIDPIRGEKDTIRNLREHPECCIHIVSRDLLEAMNNSSIDAPRGFDEFAFCGVTPAPCDTISCDRIAEAHVAYEGVVTHLIEVGEPAPAGALVVVRINRMHVSEHVWEADRKRINFEQLAPVARLAGLEFGLIGERITLSRPVYPPATPSAESSVSSSPDNPL